MLKTLSSYSPTIKFKKSCSSRKKTSQTTLGCKDMNSENVNVKVSLCAESNNASTTNALNVKPKNLKGIGANIQHSHRGSSLLNNGTVFGPC